MVDLIFARTGWQRMSRVGENQRDIDLLLREPETGETAFVQVKSKAGQAVLDDCIERSRAYSCNHMFFVCHTPTGTLSTRNQPGLHIWVCDCLADMAVKAALYDWLIERTS